MSSNYITNEAMKLQFAWETSYCI